MDGRMGRAVAGHVSRIEQLTSEWATLDVELASLGQLLEKSDDAFEECRAPSQQPR